MRQRGGAAAEGGGVRARRLGVRRRDVARPGDDDVHATKLELMAALYKNPNDPYPYKELKEDMSGIEDWDVSRIDDFKEVFSGAGSFNADLSKWDVAQGTDFTDMFGGAGSFNADLSKWNVAKGTKFEFMVRVARPRGGVAS